MKVFVQLGAAVLAALAIVPTPGTEGAAISYGKRVKCAWHSLILHGRIQNLTFLRLNLFSPHALATSTGYAGRRPLPWLACNVARA